MQRIEQQEREIIILIGKLVSQIRVKMQRIEQQERERIILIGKLVSQIRVKWQGDMFQLFKFPYQFSQITPHLVQNVELLSGTWGTVGSVIRWTYTHDGVKSTSKDMIEVIDEKKKSMTFKVMEGDPIKLYKAFKVIVEVESNGNGEDNMLTWSLEYEKLNAGVPDPTHFLEFLLGFSKDVERSRQLVPN